MSTFTPGNLATVSRDLGRGIVFVSDYWDGSAPYAPSYVSDSLGDMEMTPNDQDNFLTADETTGLAPIKAYQQGEAPVVTIPFYVGDKTILETISPTGSASGGWMMQQPVAEKTAVIFPEQLFRKPDNTRGTLTWTGTEWQLSGVALNAAQLALLDQSRWLWRLFFRKPTIGYRHGNGGRSVFPTEGVLMIDFSKPDGHLLYTVGDPADYGIDLDGES